MDAEILAQLTEILAQLEIINTGISIILGILIGIGILYIFNN